jgi:quercetin dioxygenase-like cupin family protein
MLAELSNGYPTEESLTVPPQEHSPRQVSRREVTRVIIAATGAALTFRCGSIPNARSTSMKMTAQDAAIVTPRVVKVRLENDRVRVLEFISNPGDKESWHSHPPFVVYVVTGGTLRITTADGQSNDVQFKTGDVFYRTPVTHTTENVGTTQLHAILVEMEMP